jgi:hypothetical protein
MTAKDLRRGSRVRLVSLLAPPLIALALFTAWAQPWVILTLDDGVRITAMGDRAAAVLPALAVASLALTAALALASAPVRIVLGVLLGLLGLLVVITSAQSMLDPVGSAASGVTALTGVDGERSVRALIVSAQVTGWPVVSVALGVAATVVGGFVAVTARAWPRQGERYDRVSTPAADAGEESIGAWDALSDGRDPTAR